MSDIAASLNRIKGQLPMHVTLVAVSKTKPIEDILEAYEAGQRVFGENRPQELRTKAEALPIDIQWHMIGHLQSNKVKYLIEHTSLIHSIDSISLLEEVNKRAARIPRIMDVLLQIHIAKEEQKFGFDSEELRSILASGVLDRLEHIRVRGLMGMATFTDDEAVIRGEFKGLKSLFEEVKGLQGDDFDTLSMGMSGDYELAIEEGSTMVRIGSSIFGQR
jgi:pyridoxal phosphate enzyme (YggS family)